jgi:hypothetical protein
MVIGVVRVVAVVDCGHASRGAVEVRVSEVGRPGDVGAAFRVQPAAARIAWLAASSVEPERRARRARCSAQLTVASRAWRQISAPVGVRRGTSKSGQAELCARPRETPPAKALRSAP